MVGQTLLGVLLPADHASHRGQRLGRWTMFHALRGRIYEAEKQDHLDHPAPLDEDERASPSGRAALRLRAPLCREVPERDDE